MKNFAKRVSALVLALVVGAAALCPAALAAASLPDLRTYLALRESSPLYESVRENGSIGIPAFVLENGTVTLDLADVLK